MTTPVLADDEEATFWVQQGEDLGSGIAVFTYSDVVEAMGDLNMGDEVTVTGTYIQPFGFNEIRLTNANNLAVTGTGSLPTPYVIEASVAQDGFLSEASLLGMIVELQNGTVGETPTYENYYHFDVDGVASDASPFDNSVWIDVAEDYPVSSLVGVMHLDYGEATIVPRQEEDVVFTYPGCETIASDANSLQSLNCRAHADGTNTTLTGLLVVSQAPFFGNSFFAIDPEADSFGGALIYSFDDLNSPPAIGDTVNVTGELSEYKGRTEIVIDGSDDISVTASGADVTPTTLSSACDLTEAHEGTLVTIASVTVGNQDTHAEDNEYFEVDGCSTVRVDGVFFDDGEFAGLAGGAGTITNLTGIVDSYLEARSINPRSSDDWEAWGGSAR